MSSPIYTFAASSVPRTAPASRTSFPIYAPNPNFSLGRLPSVPSTRSSVPAPRRRSALGRTILFSSESSDEEDSADETDKDGVKSSGESDADEEHEVTTPDDEHGPLQPLVVKVPLQATAMEDRARALAKLTRGRAVVAQVAKEQPGAGIGKRMTADELRKRLNRNASAEVQPPVVLVQQQQQVAKPPVVVVKTPQTPIAKAKADPRKELGLKAAMGSYQERRRVGAGHRRSQSSTSVEVPKLAEDLRASIEAANAANSSSDSKPSNLTLMVPLPSPSICITPASPEQPKSCVLPSPPSSPTPSSPSTFSFSARRVASDSITKPERERRWSDELKTGVAPPSLDQIRKWAMKRDKTTGVQAEPVVQQQQPPVEGEKKRISEEREKARSALGALANIPIRSSSISAKCATPRTVPSTPTIVISVPQQVPTPFERPQTVRALSVPVPSIVSTPPPPPSPAAKTATVVFRPRVPAPPVSPTRSFSLPVRAFRPPTGAAQLQNRDRARIMQAQSMMARLSLRAGVAAAQRPKSPVLPLVGAV